MNYKKVYNNIVFIAKNENRLRGDGCYYESHHIIPKSLGGTNDKDNLVLLTPKEHFVCHLLLTKMFDGKHKSKMLYAFFGMSNGWVSGDMVRYDKINSKIYSKLKEEMIKIRSKDQQEFISKLSSTERKEKYGNVGNSNPMFGNTHSEESKMKIKQARYKQTFTQSYRDGVKKSAISRSGENNYLTKYTKPEWDNIYIDMKQNKIPHKDVAVKYDISKRTVENLSTCRHWSNRDPISCGSVVAVGSSNVFVGG